MNTLQKYLKKIRGVNVLELQLKGHLTIRCNDKVVWDRHNLIVDQGKGYVMDLLASIGASYTYTPSPFNGIVLTKNTATELAADTFVSSVYTSGNNKISNEGVLHVEVGSGGHTVITHAAGSLNLSLTGTIGQAYGNLITNNHINSVCICSGLNPNYGGPGQAAYTATGNERLFARVHVGDLVKTAEKSYSFSWLITIQ